MSKTKRNNERGVSAVITALMLIAMFAAAAVAFDLSNLARERQDLNNLMDTAAHAAASFLPDDPVSAVNVAKSIGHTTAGVDPSVNLLCVIASEGETKRPKPGQIPSVCDPGPAGLAAVKCDEFICVMPCAASPTTTCNAAKVWANKDVDYGLAPVIGFLKGNTGAVETVACKGSCGALMPNPMDVVVVADRTLSMPEADLNVMKSGIKSMLTTMEPNLQYVALGTIHRGHPSNPCYISSSASYGPWVITNFSRNYLRTGSAGAPQVNPSSELVYRINCIQRPGGTGATYGTHLAAAMNGAMNSLLSGATSSMPTRPGKVQKVIIFETDGMPDEVLPTANVYASDPAGGTQRARWLRQNYPSYYPFPVNTPWHAQTAAQRASGGGAGCQRLVEVAQRAKNAGILVITIGYGDAATAGCNISQLRGDGTFDTDGPQVRDYLAAAASPAKDGSPSTAGHNCATAAGAAAENSDGDFFFCAANSDQLAPIFETAISQAREGIRFLALPQ